MASTYDLIATKVIAASEATFDFTSIPSTYTDLVLSAQYGTGATETAYIRFNGDTASNYETIIGSAGAPSASTANWGTATSANVNWYSYAPSGVIGTDLNLHIYQYANTHVFKNLQSLSGGGTTGYCSTMIGGYVWKSTAAITSITIYQSGVTTFLNGSKFYLYGIKAA